MRTLVLALLCGILAIRGESEEKEKRPAKPHFTQRGIRGLGSGGGANAVVFGHYHALLIGIDDYPARPLETPLKDIKALAGILKDEYAFSTIRILVNEAATRTNILSVMREMGEAIPAEDSFFLYFAGHGDLVRGDAFWIPHGADDKQESWISADDVRAKIRKMTARHVLLVSDSCFSGGFGRAPAPRGQDSIDNYLRRVLAKKSREVITSGGLEPVADGGENELSLFAYYFTLTLQSAEWDYVTARDVIREVAPLVANRGSQTPEWGPIPDTDDQRGHFVFIRAGADHNVKVTGDERLKGRARGPGSQYLPDGWSLPGTVAAIDAKNGIYRSTGVDSSEMILVRPDWFPFGGNGPKVKVGRPFLIDRYEVTVERFRNFIRAEGMPRVEVLFWNQRNYSNDSQPVVGVNIDHARRFAKWAGKVVPSEVQWEFAAAWDYDHQRHRPYPWGDSFEAFRLRYRTAPPPVELARKLGDISPWGVCGMGSGVREWCEPAMRDGSPPVVRGATQIRTGRRNYSKLKTTSRREKRVLERSHDIGFRCILYLNSGG